MICIDATSILRHKKEKQKRSNTSYADLTKLRRALCWDTDMDKIDWHEQKRSVTQSVFERENDAEKEEITRFYVDSEIRQFTKKPDPSHA